LLPLTPKGGKGEDFVLLFLLTSFLNNGQHRCVTQLYFYSYIELLPKRIFSAAKVQQHTKINVVKMEDFGGVEKCVK
jgi:hypothetical protein